MAKKSKQMRAALEKIDSTKAYSLCGDFLNTSFGKWHQSF